eukprot:519107_1
MTEQILKTYQDLMRMGFEEQIALEAASKFKGNLNKSIEYITSATNDNNKTEHESKTNTSLNDNSDQQKEREAKMNERLVCYQKLVKLGFGEKISMKAATFWPTNIDNAVSYIKTHQKKPSNEIDEKKAENIKPTKATVFNESHCNAQTCSSVSVIRDFLRFYQKNMNEVTKKNPYCDRIAQLLNAHIHILENHSDWLEELYHFIGLKCDLNHCQSVRRNYRNRVDVNSNYNKLINNLCSKDSVMMSIMDQIHSYCLHTFDIGYRLTTKEKQAIMVKLQSDDNKQDTGSGDISFVKLNSVLKKKRVHYGTISEGKQHSKFVTAFNYQQQEAKYNKLSEPVSVSIKDEDIKDEDKYAGGKQRILVYSFSEAFRYVKTKNEFIHNDEIPVSKKYVNLKDEILNNAICHVNADVWTQVQTKVEQYLQCDRVRRSFNDSNHNYHWNTTKLTVIVLYTDYDDLSYKFSESFRKIKSNETTEQLVSRHRNYYWFASTLLNTVNCHSYGYRNSCQYHGISTMMSFNTTIAQFNHPTSTTKRIEVASHFATNSGIILQLKIFKDSWGHGYVKYLDCSWISVYANEDEMLYFRSGALQFSNIIICATGNTCKQFLHPFNILISAMNGDSINKSDYMSESVSKKEQKLILSMLKNKIKVDDEYFMSIFNQYRKNKMYVKLDIYYITRKGFGGYTFLADLLLTQPNDVLNSWIHMKMVLNLFVNCKEIVLTNFGAREPVYITKKYINSICYSLKKCHKIMHSLERIIIEKATIPKMYNTLDIGEQFSEETQKFIAKLVGNKLIITNLYNNNNVGMGGMYNDDSELAHALAMSMQGNGNNNNNNVNNINTNYNGNDDEDTMLQKALAMSMEQNKNNNNSGNKKDMDEDKKIEIVDEPDENDTDCCTIQLRLGNIRIKRRFKKEHKLNDVANFVKSKDSKYNSIVFVCPPMNRYDDMNMELDTVSKELNSKKLSFSVKE